MPVLSSCSRLCTRTALHEVPVLKRTDASSPDRSRVADGSLMRSNLLKTNFASTSDVTGAEAGVSRCVT